MVLDEKDLIESNDLKYIVNDETDKENENNIINKEDIIEKKLNYKKMGIIFLIILKLTIKDQ